MGPRDIKTGEGDTKATQSRLTFTTDVEQTRVESDRYCQPREHEVRRIIKRITPAVSRAERPGYHQLYSGNRVLPDCKDHQRRQDCGQQQRDERHEDYLGPFWHHIHLFRLPVARMGEVFLDFRHAVRCVRVGDACHEQAQFFLVRLRG